VGLKPWSCERKEKIGELGAAETTEGERIKLMSNSKEEKKSDLL